MESLTEDLKTEYDRNGAVVIRGAFSEAWLQNTETAIEKNKLSPSQYGENVLGEGGKGAYFNDYLNWKTLPEIQDYVYNSPAAKIAKFLTGSTRIVFYHEHILCKDPDTAKTTPWHHDQSYYPLDGDQVASIWMPIDHVAKTETLYFVKGSHKLGYFLPYKFASERPYPVTDEELHKKMKFRPLPEDITDLGEVIGWEVARGDCVVFNGKTVHGAPSNMSKEHRRVLSTRWLGDDVVCAQRPWVCSPPVTGRLEPGDKFEQDGLFPCIEC